MCDAIALYGARLALKNLPEAVRRGQDITARSRDLVSPTPWRIPSRRSPDCTIAQRTVSCCLMFWTPHVLEFNRSVSADRLRDLGCCHGTGSPCVAVDFGGWDSID